MFGIAHGELFHTCCHRDQRISSWITTAQTWSQETPEGVSQRVVFRLVLVHDHGGAQGGGTGCIGILVLIGSLGERHQNAGCAGDGEFAQAAGSSSADGQIGMLQQPWNFIAEGLLRQLRVLQAACFGIVTATEVHHPAAGFEQIG